MNKLTPIACCCLLLLPGQSGSAAAQPPGGPVVVGATAPDGAPLPSAAPPHAAAPPTSPAPRPAGPGPGTGTGSGQPARAALPSGAGASPTAPPTTPARAVQPQQLVPGKDPRGVRARLVTPGNPWKFRHDRPVQAVVIGCSISGWLTGGWPDWLMGACPGLEVVNLSKTNLGAAGLANTFRQDVVRNATIHPHPPGRERWLLFLGGVNSVASPLDTIKHLRRLFRMAHQDGWQVLAFTLTPWGNEHESYWKGMKGLQMLRSTQQVTDFIMGRGSGTLAAEERADRAIELLNSPLRDRDARLRDARPLREQLRTSSEWRRRLAPLTQEDAAALVDQTVAEAQEVPRWYLRREYQAFDSTHLNTAGHHLIARLACPAMPAAAACDCALLEQLRWDGLAGGVVAPLPLPADQTRLPPRPAPPTPAP